jgi:LPXTG-motif cell wall-anchored protein
VAPEPTGGQAAPSPEPTEPTVTEPEHLAAPAATQPAASGAQVRQVAAGELPRTGAPAPIATALGGALLALGAWVLRRTAAGEV